MRSPEQASSQTAEPAAGWKQILLRVYDDFGKHRVMTIAAGIAFYSLLALFPALAALVSVYGLFADPSTIADHLTMLAGVLPGGAIGVIGDELQRLTAQPASQLSVTFAVGLVTALWSANAGIKTMFDALNLVHDEPERRGLITVNAMSLAFTAALIGFVLVALAAMVALPPLLPHLRLGATVETFVTLLRWPALLVVVGLVISALYRFGPSRGHPRWRWLSAGSAFAAVAWLVVSLLFSWYAANFGSYDKTYGSLGAAVGFMVWIWLSTMVVLLGAELDAAIEHDSAKAWRLA
ncbi:MAG TPA: YihY/virulence factor BrkB family protein [Pseudolabrys sp.]|nr:YihY/virulence factor BrkB family protein [Pseudolabrys sp.]